MRRVAAVGFLMAACGGGVVVATTTGPTTPARTSTEPSSVTLAAIAVPTTSVPTTSAITTTTTTTAQPVTTIAATPPDATFFVFMPRGLPDDFEQRIGVLAGVTELALVHTETLHIMETATADGTVVDRPRSGYVIPVQGIAVDPTRHGPLVSDDVGAMLEALGPDEVLLGSASAQLRRLDVGGIITLDDGRRLTVVGITADTEFGNEELITTNPEVVGGDGSELRFGIVRFAGDTDALTAGVTQALGEGAGFGIHARGRPQDQTTAVRSQIWIKQTFGEFAYRPTGNGFVIDPDWVSEHIITVQIPVLGTVRCHRVFVEALRQVMSDLAALGQDDAIERSAYRGCYNPRYVANSKRLSRHAWGAAADINFFNALDGGPGSPVNEALLAAMAEHGVTSGHNWSIPDPGHFEYYGFPENESYR